MRLFLKAAVVGFITLAILIPLALIGDIVRDRQAYRRQAVDDIAANVGRAQTVAGPVLVVPYLETRVVQKTDDNGNVRNQIESSRKQTVYFPKTVEVKGTLPVEMRARGMHKVRVYEWQGRIAANFDVTLPADTAEVTRTFERPWLALEFSDPRGLQGVPELRLDGRDLRIQPGAGFRPGNGVHARLAAPVAGEAMKFDAQLSMQLRGTQVFSILPVADDNMIELRSNWQAPKFMGASPTQPPAPKGFSAVWRVSALSINVQDDYATGKPLSQRPPADERANMETTLPGRVSVALIDPVNAYASTARAIKYGLLFVAVTFAGFFLFEFLKQVPIHPIQYLLVGFSIAMFFLLLLSMGEHIAFGWAYVLAALACVGLITYYLAAVLRAWAPALGFAGLLAALYGVLYGVLVSEDNALVMGSALLFVLLAAIMVLTRKVDWYAISGGSGGWRSLFGGPSGEGK